MVRRLSAAKRPPSEGKTRDAPPQHCRSAPAGLAIGQAVNEFSIADERGEKKETKHAAAVRESAQGYPVSL
jgi:hypothetical protein